MALVFENDELGLGKKSQVCASVAADYEGEVVGCRGRMGSAFTRFSAGRLAQVGRNDCIGSQSPKNTPIFVCTGVDAIEDVIHRTPKERVDDLVIMQVSGGDDLCASICAIHAVPSHFT